MRKRSISTSNHVREDKKPEQRPKEITVKYARGDTDKHAYEETKTYAIVDDSYAKHVSSIQHSSHKLSKTNSESRWRSDDERRDKKKRSSPRSSEDHSGRKKRFVKFFYLYIFIKKLQYIFFTQIWSGECNNITI